MGNEPKKRFRINKSVWNEPEKWTTLAKNEPKKPFRISQGWVRTLEFGERTQGPGAAAGGR